MKYLLYIPTGKPVEFLGPDRDNLVIDLDVIIDYYIKSRIETKITTYNDFINRILGGYLSNTFYERFDIDFKYTRKLQFSDFEVVEK